MEPIRVPRPSSTAFHKNRRISDLLLWQIEHFRHVAEKRSIKVGPEVARDVHTEGGAARYIATVTRALQKGVRAKPAKVVPMRGVRRIRPAKAEQSPATGVVPRIAAGREEPKRGRSKKRSAAEQATSPKSAPARRSSSATASKKSKSRTKSATGSKAKAASKVRSKTRSGKRKKS
jgi:hypothetical protein